LAGFADDLLCGAIDTFGEFVEACVQALQVRVESILRIGGGRRTGPGVRRVFRCRIRMGGHVLALLHRSLATHGVPDRCIGNTNGCLEPVSNGAGGTD
jgi:hypothetical protein